MGEFSILTNRKRAMIALVHSVVFLLVAVQQMILVQRWQNSKVLWLATDPQPKQ